MRQDISAGNKDYVYPYTIKDLEKGLNSFGFAIRSRTLFGIYQLFYIFQIVLERIYVFILDVIDRGLVHI